MGAAQGFVGPSVQGVMSARVPANAQGELQGSLASVSSLASIIAPLLMTQLFGYFTGPAAPFYFPGVSYLLAACLVLVSCMVLIPAMRSATRSEASVG